MIREVDQKGKLKETYPLLWQIKLHHVCNPVVGWAASAFIPSTKTLSSIQERTKQVINKKGYIPCADPKPQTVHWLDSSSGPSTPIDGGILMVSEGGRSGRNMSTDRRKSTRVTVKRFRTDSHHTGSRTSPQLLCRVLRHERGS
jgi:hypothetical protein